MWMHFLGCGDFHQRWLHRCCCSTKEMLGPDSGSGEEQGWAEQPWASCKSSGDQEGRRRDSGLRAPQTQTFPGVGTARDPGEAGICFGCGMCRRLYRALL